MLQYYYRLKHSRARSNNPSKVEIDLLLADAALSADYNKLEALLKTKIKSERSNDTVLNQAIRCGHQQLVKLILGKRFKCDNSSLFEPLHFAVMSGDVRLTKLLIKTGAIVDAVDFNQCTPLHKAVEENHNHLVSLLLKYRANIHAETSSGCTPLHLAAKKAHMEIVKNLIQNGAEINSDNEFRGCTPLHFASRYGHTNVVRYLINQGADINARSTFGWTPLNAAARLGHYSVTQLLIEAGADIELTAEKGDNLPIPKALVNPSGLSWKRESCKIKAKGGLTPLHSASEAGHEHIVKLLLNTGVDVNVQISSNGKTPLHLAAEKHHQNIVELLILNCANFEQIDFRGNTPLESTYDLESKKMIIKYIALLKKTNIIDCKVVQDSELRQFWEDCEDEIKLMKNVKLGCTRVSLYTILKNMFNDLQLFCYLARNEIRIYLMDLQPYIFNFPLYETLISLIEDKIRQTFLRHDLLIDAETIMDLYFPQLPVYVSRHILSYFSNNELTYFNKTNFTN